MANVCDVIAESALGLGTFNIKCLRFYITLKENLICNSQNESQSPAQCHLITDKRSTY